MKIKKAPVKKPELQIINQNDYSINVIVISKDYSINIMCLVSTFSPLWSL